jgi:DNA-binding transcriptional MerR regulator
MTEQLRYGTSTFLRRTGISAPMMRGLEAAGVILPEKSDRGWRLFRESDVRAVLQWKTTRRRRKATAPER